LSVVGDVPLNGSLSVSTSSTYISLIAKFAGTRKVGVVDSIVLLLIPLTLETSLDEFYVVSKVIAPTYYSDAHRSRTSNTSWSTWHLIFRLVTFDRQEAQM
jgi:hypothetical protein